MAATQFTTAPFNVGEWIIVKLPANADPKMPSHGPVMVVGTINGHDFQTPLEPDGMGGHWFPVGKALAHAASVEVGNSTDIIIEPTKNWPEPQLPADIAKALAADAEARQTWQSTTPLAHWEWVRWIRATNSTETRTRRIGVACSKLRKGMRRPCCFNSSMCTEPSVSKNGVLLVPTPA